MEARGCNYQTLNIRVRRYAMLSPDMSRITIKRRILVGRAYGGARRVIEQIKKIRHLTVILS